MLLGNLFANPLSSVQKSPCHYITGPSVNTKLHKEQGDMAISSPPTNIQHKTSEKFVRTMDGGSEYDAFVPLYSLRSCAHLFWWSMAPASANPIRSNNTASYTNHEVSISAQIWGSRTIWGLFCQAHEHTRNDKDQTSSYRLSLPNHQYTTPDHKLRPHCLWGIASRTPMWQW